MKRFVIRDKKTKEIGTGWDGKITLDFTDLSAAKTFYSSIPFGLNFYYEIFDTKHNKVIIEAFSSTQKWRRN